MKTLCESRGYVLYLASDEEICRGKAEDREDIYIDTQDAFRKLLKAGAKYGDTITAGIVLCMDRYGMSAGAGCGASAAFRPVRDREGLSRAALGRHAPARGAAAHLSDG